ncbi:MAG TPA: DUF6624 domain-containing protein [Bacteriovoracaceae bacterium]|nr:DUF6624 domain-containing protein [Bacteriovoracaceae bacterium]
MSHEFWEEKLSLLIERDLRLREVLLQRGVLADTYHPEMEKIHLENARKLKALIEKFGFPVLSNAQEKGVRSSWLIIQHAISWPDFMKESLLQMRLAAAAEDYILELVAYTEDRVAFFEGRPQLYGTNCDWQEGELKMTPVLEPERLDLRRKSLGLPPIETVQTPGTLERPPKDAERKKQEFEIWLRKTGWRS